MAVLFGIRNSSAKLVSNDVLLDNHDFMQI
jgi:hypothetical protein